MRPFKDRGIWSLNCDVDGLKLLMTDRRTGQRLLMVPSNCLDDVLSEIQPEIRVISHHCGSEMRIYEKCINMGLLKSRFRCKDLLESSSDLERLEANNVMEQALLQALLNACAPTLKHVALGASVTFEDVSPSNLPSTISTTSTESLLQMRVHYLQVPRNAQLDTLELAYTTSRLVLHTVARCTALRTLRFVDNPPIPYRHFGPIYKFERWVNASSH